MGFELGPRHMETAKGTYSDLNTLLHIVIIIKNIIFNPEFSCKLYFLKVNKINIIIRNSTLTKTIERRLKC